MRARLLPDDHRILAGARRQVTDDGGFEVELGLHLDQWSSKIENAVNSEALQPKQSGSRSLAKEADENS